MKNINFIQSVAVFICTIPGAYNASLYRIRCNGFQIIGPANFRHAINEKCCDIGAIIAELTSFVVPWECVMIIVPTFPDCKYGHRLILHWIYESLKIVIGGMRGTLFMFKNNEIFGVITRDDHSFRGDCSKDTQRSICITSPVKVPNFSIDF